MCRKISPPAQIDAAELRLPEEKRGFTTAHIHTQRTHTERERRTAARSNQRLSSFLFCRRNSFIICISVLSSDKAIATEAETAPQEKE
jgi:hypothetical protein